jgi:hypothetical protein
MLHVLFTDVHCSLLKWSSFIQWISPPPPSFLWCSWSAESRHSWSAWLNSASVSSEGPSLMNAAPIHHPWGLTLHKIQIKWRISSRTYVVLRVVIHDNIRLNSLWVKFSKIWKILRLGFCFTCPYVMDLFEIFELVHWIA